MNGEVLRRSRLGRGWYWAGWIGVGLTILTLLVFAGIRTVETYGGEPAPNLFVERYIDHPWTTAIHMISGIGFVLLAPLQFVAAIRNRYRTFHRSLGRVLLIFAFVAGVYGLVSVVTFPAYGGVTTEAAGWFFGPLFLFAIVRAFQQIRRKNVAAHREWMIRAFALGLGVGMQRIAIGFWQVFSDYTIEEIFGVSLWIGFAINLCIAEYWINKTRPTGRAPAA